MRTDTDNLGVPGSYREVTTRHDATSYLGFGGSIIVRGYDEYSSPYAYDMACPYEKTATTRIKMNSQTMKAECSKCGSTFDGLFWGNPAPSSGPAFEGKLYLRKYSATIRDFNIYINN